MSVNAHYASFVPTSKPMATRRVSGAGLTYPAIVAYKEWVWRELIRRGLPLQHLVDEIKALDRVRWAKLTTSTLSQFLGPKDLEAPREASSSDLVPFINHILGAAAPPASNPSDPLLEIQAKFAERWPKLTIEHRELLLRTFGIDPEILKRS